MTWWEDFNPRQVWHFVCFQVICKIWMISVLWIRTNKSGDCCQVSRGSGWNQGIGGDLVVSKWPGKKKTPRRFVELSTPKNHWNQWSFGCENYYFLNAIILDAQKVESQQCLDTWFFWLHAGVTQISRDIAGTLHPDQPGQPELQPRPQRSGAFITVIPNFPSVLSVKKVMVFSWVSFQTPLVILLHFAHFGHRGFWLLIPSISSQGGIGTYQAVELGAFAFRGCHLDV